MYDLDKIGERVKELRIRNGYTQEEISEALGMSFGSYRAIETGRRTGRVETLCLIAEYYEVPLDYLLNREKDSLEELSWGLNKLPKERQRLARRLMLAVLDVLGTTKL